jgi:two-component system, response regulator RegA
VTEPQPVLLVVDDDLGIVRLIDRFARTLGFEVVTAACGQEAMAKLESDKAAVALVDLRMPDADGLEVLRRIRAADPNCQVILMTGDGSIDTAIEAIKLGAMDYLGKPLEFERLKQLLSGARDHMETLASLDLPSGNQPDISDLPLRDARGVHTHLLSDVERDHITRVLRGTAGNKKAAAQLLGVSRRALYRKLDRLGLR